MSNKQKIEELLNMMAEGIDRRDPAKRDISRITDKLKDFERKLFQKMMMDPKKAKGELKIAIDQFTGHLKHSTVNTEPLYAATLKKFKDLMQAIDKKGAVAPMKMTKESLDEIIQDITSRGPGSGNEDQVNPAKFHKLDQVNEYMTRNLKRIFPGKEWILRAGPGGSLRAFSSFNVSVAYVPDGDSNLARLNSKFRIDLMAHLTDSRGRFMADPKVTFISLGQSRGGLKYRKITGKDLPDAATKLIKWLEKWEDSVYAELAKKEDINEEGAGAAVSGTTTGDVAIKPNALFGKIPVFDCDNGTFSKCIKGKQKSGRWATYLGDESDFYNTMRTWMGQSYKNTNFMLRNKMTGEMIHARPQVKESLDEMKKATSSSSSKVFKGNSGASKQATVFRSFKVRDNFNLPDGQRTVALRKGDVVDITDKGSYLRKVMGDIQIPDSAVANAIIAKHSSRIDTRPYQGWNSVDLAKEINFQNKKGAKGDTVNAHLMTLELVRRNQSDLLNKYKLPESQVDEAMPKMRDSKWVIYNTKTKQRNKETYKTMPAAKAAFDKMNNPLMKVASEYYYLDNVAPEKRESVTEAKQPEYQIYHNSYSAAVSAVLAYIKKKGFDVDDNEVFTEISHGPKKPAPGGKTNKIHLRLLKDDKLSRKVMHFQVYGMPSGNFELNMYIS